MTWRTASLRYLSSKAEGVAIATTTIIRNMLNTTNLSYEQIAKIASTTIEEIQRIAKDTKAHS